MAKVTIGVPVFNGEDLIGECLECLVNQTYRDIEFLIYDNASTDRTAEIIESYAARDPRIRFTRRPENVGAIANFIEPVDVATSPYFLWRAHDDLCSADYVEKLVAAIEGQPGAKLATGTIEHVGRGGKTRVYVPKQPGHSQRAIEVVQLLFHSHAGWYYGLWETATIRALVHEVWTRFPHAWASDHLTLYPLLLDRAVAMAPETRFIQRVVVKGYTPPRGYKAPLDHLKAMRRSFAEICDDFLSRRDFGPWETRLIRLATWFYLGKRVYKFRRILKRSIVERVFPPRGA